MSVEGGPRGDIRQALGSRERGYKTTEIRSLKDVPAKSRIFKIPLGEGNYPGEQEEALREARNILSSLKFRSSDRAVDNGQFWQGFDTSNNQFRLYTGDLIGKMVSDPTNEELLLVNGPDGKMLQTVVVQVPNILEGTAYSVIYDKARPSDLPGEEGTPERVLLVCHKKEGMTVYQIDRRPKKEANAEFDAWIFERKPDDNGYTDGITGDPKQFADNAYAATQKLEIMLQERKTYRPSDTAKRV